MKFVLTKYFSPSFVLKNVLHLYFSKKIYFESLGIAIKICNEKYFPFYMKTNCAEPLKGTSPNKLWHVRAVK